MFFVTYVRRELRRRMRQALCIALGLALGVGLVVTVAAASAGVTKAQSRVLSTLYGAATTVTVTGPQWRGPSKNPKGTPGPVAGPHGPQICVVGGKCTSAAGKTLTTSDILTKGISVAKVAAAARLPGVAAAAGGIFLNESWFSWPKDAASIARKGGISRPARAWSSPRRCRRPGGGRPGGLLPGGGREGGYPLEGVDTADPALGPLGGASLVSGRLFTAADTGADVAVVDSRFAAVHRLRIGAVWPIVGPADAHGYTPAIKFTVIGIVGQAAGINAPSVYVPLKAAQDLLWVQTGPWSLHGKVTTIYLVAASAADVSAVTQEVTKLLPGTTVDSASNLATAVAGSVKSAAKLAHDLGRWLAVLVLIAVFAVASLLTMAAVARRAAEFGTLKALGWRTRRIIAQVLGESLATGLGGAAAGIAVGYAGAAVIAAVTPSVSAIVGSDLPPAPGDRLVGGSPVETVAVPLHPSVSAGLIALAVLLALAGALLAGALGSWRIAQLRPADALSRVA
jgi:putative ABC transport system permease protein